MPWNIRQRCWIRLCGCSREVLTAEPQWSTVQFTVSTELHTQTLCARIRLQQRCEIRHILQSHSVVRYARWRTRWVTWIYQSLMRIPGYGPVAFSSSRDSCSHAFTVEVHVTSIVDELSLSNFCFHSFESCLCILQGLYIYPTWSLSNRSLIIK